MNREKTLAKNTIIYAIGNFGSKFLSFLLLPFYTYYLTTADYGYFDLINTTLSLLVPLISFQIYDGLYRYLLDSKNYNDTSNIVSNSFFLLIRNLLIFNVAYLIFVQFKSFKYEYLILLQIDFSLLSGLWTQISRGLKNNIEYSISGVISTIVTLTSNMLFIIVMNLRVGSLILSNAISSIIVIVYLDCKLKIHKYIKYKFIDNEIKRKLILFSIPLIPNVISWWFMNVSDRYFLNFYKGIEANGIYAVSNRFPSLLIMVNSIFNLAWQESAICEYSSKDKNEFYTKMFNILMILEFTSVIVLLSFTKFIITFMVNKKFYSAWIYIPFLYMGTIFSAFSSFYGTGYLSSKDTVGAFFTSLYGGTINIILNITLIPVIGIQGASLSTMISFLIMWLVRLLQTRKYFKIIISKNKLITLSIIITAYIFFYYYNNLTVEYTLMFLSIIIFLYFNKDLLIKGKEFVKSKITSLYYNK